MKELRISVKDKIATLVEDVELVCGNSDYRVVFEFDNDWEKYNAKTALFVFGDTTVEVPFFGNVIEPEDAVAIERATKCYVGVYTGDLITTTKAEVKCLPSITDIAKKPSPPKEDVYLRLIKLLNDIKLGGSAIIEVDELPQDVDEINSNILYRTSEGLFYYNGLWEKLIDESDIESIRHDLDVVESLAKGAHQAVSFGNYETMVTALNALPKDTYKIPQSIMIVTLNVPDLWVSAIAEESAPYTYVDDTTLAEAIKTNGSVQVGYYVLSALETQKVDLTDYVKNTDYATTEKYGLIKVTYGDQSGLRITAQGLRTYGVEQSTIDAKSNAYRPITPAYLDYATKVSITTNKYTLTDEEKASAKNWLGVPTTYDELKDKPFGGGYDINLTSTQSGMNYPLVRGVAYRVSDTVYRPDELFGATVKYAYGSYTPTKALTETLLIEDDGSGCTFKIADNVYIIICYDDYGYVPSEIGSQNNPIMDHGVYFSFYDDGDPYGVISLRKELLKTIDNKYLDLENNSVIKALMARIEALENK